MKTKYKIIKKGADMNASSFFNIYIDIDIDLT